MRKEICTVAVCDNISYCDIPSAIGRLRNKGYAIDNIITTSSIKFKGKYLITAYKGEV